MIRGIMLNIAPPSESRLRSLKEDGEAGVVEMTPISLKLFNILHLFP